MENINLLNEREKIVLKFIYVNKGNHNEFKTYFRNESQAKILQDLELKGLAFDVIRNEKDEIIDADLPKKVKEYFK